MKELKSVIQAHKAGKLERAESLYRKAISSGLAHPISYSNLGSLLRQQGCLDEALAASNRAIEPNPDEARSYAT